MSTSDNATDRRERPPGFVWRRAAIGLVVLVVVLLGVGFFREQFGGGRSPERLEAVVEELDRSDPTWRLEQMEAAREQLPEGENSARVVMAVSRMLPKSWPTTQIDD